MFAGTVKKSTNGKLTWTGNVYCHLHRLPWVLDWGSPEKQEMVFVANLGDLFHEKVPFEFIDRAITYMLIANWNIYQILTKRPDRMLEYFTSPNRINKISRALAEVKAELTRKIKIIRKEIKGEELDQNLTKGVIGRIEKSFARLESTQCQIPFPNLWLGVSVCNQEDADKFIDPLLQTPAAIRYISFEPLLTDIDLSKWLSDGKLWHWGIVGGESGGKDIRPTYIQHLRSVKTQLQNAGIPTFIKQLGKFPIVESGDFPLQLLGNKTGKAELDNRQLLLKDSKGGDITEFPEDLKVREFPGLGF